MFSEYQRQILPSNQLAEVICQLHFPKIESIAQVPPPAFREAIRSVFPLYIIKQGVPSVSLFAKGAGPIGSSQEGQITHQFSSSDGTWRVSLCATSVSLVCRHYTRWEDFAHHLDHLLAAFIRTCCPSHFQRIGLRYLNFISRKCLNLEGVPYRELIHPEYLGPLAFPHLQEQHINRCSIDVDLALAQNCRAKIHAGPGVVRHKGAPDKEVRFIFDQDLYQTGNIPISHVAASLDTLHTNAYTLFRSAITDRLLQAMRTDPSA